MMRLELLRLWRARRPLVATFSLVFFVGLMLLGFYTYAQSRTGGQADFRYTFENRSYFNGLTFAVYTFYFGFLLLLPVFAATEGGAQIAGDSEAGTMKLLLTRPISRARLFFTKLLVAAGLSSALVASLLALGLGIGLVTVGWGDLDLYPGVLQLTSEHQHLSQRVALQRFAMIWPLASLALFAPLALSFWIATWVKSPVNAVGSAFALYLVMYVVSQIHFFAELRPWLFTSSMAYWRELFQEDIDWVEIVRSGARLCAFSSLFLALAFRRFRRCEER
jgi:ABC-2 type transport system permease protein